MESWIVRMTVRRTVRRRVRLSPSGLYPGHTMDKHWTHHRTPDTTPDRPADRPPIRYHSVNITRLTTDCMIQLPLLAALVSFIRLIYLCYRHRKNIAHCSATSTTARCCRRQQVHEFANTVPYTRLRYQCIGTQKTSTRCRLVSTGRSVVGLGQSRTR